jgi:hypothetical protein
MHVPLLRALEHTGYDMAVRRDDLLTYRTDAPHLSTGRITVGTAENMSHALYWCTRGVGLLGCEYCSMYRLSFIQLGPTQWTVSVLQRLLCLLRLLLFKPRKQIEENDNDEPCYNENYDVHVVKV